MIRMQIVERGEAKLFSTLKRAIRSKDLRTFSLEKGGKRVVHVRSPGHMNWITAEGVIACEIRTPVESINIQLAAPAPPPVKKKRRARP